jgi:CheY-like chemotaxis protein
VNKWELPINLHEATVLLVDDEPDLLEIFGMLLKSAGCAKVLTAKDGECALDIVKNSSIDLIITDVRMPVMDGLALVRRLVELTKVVPSIVFVSGFGDIDQREMYGLGVEAFLTKPVSSEHLIEVTERALAARSTLWLAPMNPSPRQSIHLRVDEIGDTMSHNAILLGRGGFSSNYAGPIALGKVAFQCHVSSQGEVAGEGYVRWRSRLDSKIGIEFTFLDSSCRSWLLREIADINPRSFIPSLL